MTAASGADRCPITGTCARTDCTPTWCHRASGTASGADQPTLRDQLAGLDVLRLMHASLPHDPRAGDPAFCAEDGKPWPCPTYEALPLIEAREERAKAEGGAEALDKAADYWQTAGLGWPGFAADLRDRAAALRGPA